jgi:hypothetical protein
MPRQPALSERDDGHWIAGSPKPPGTRSAPRPTAERGQRRGTAETVIVPVFPPEPLVRKQGLLLDTEEPTTPTAHSSRCATQAAGPRSTRTRLCRTLPNAVVR